MSLQTFLAHVADKLPANDGPSAADGPADAVLQHSLSSIDSMAQHSMQTVSEAQARPCVLQEVPATCLQGVCEASGADCDVWLAGQRDRQEDQGALKLVTSDVQVLFTPVSRLH